MKSWNITDVSMYVVLQQGRTPKECLRTFDASVPQECQSLRISFFECKRSLVRKFMIKKKKKGTAQGKIISEKEFFST